MLRPSLEEAKALIAAAQEAAGGVDKPMTVVVVDSGGFVVASERMEGARPLTTQIATAKAYTAAIMQRPTNMLKNWCETQPEFFAQLSNLSHFPIVATDGGVTLRRDGQIIGAIGVSGGTASEDQVIAEAALTKLGFDTDFAEWNRIKKD